MTLPAISYRTAPNRFTLPPITRTPSKGQRPAKYPFATMAVNATLIFSTTTAEQRQEIRGYLAYVVSSRRLRFETRTLPDGRLAIKRLPDRTPKRGYTRKPKGAN